MGYVNVNRSDIFTDQSKFYDSFERFDSEMSSILGYSNNFVLFQSYAETRFSIGTSLALFQPNNQSLSSEGENVDGRGVFLTDATWKGKCEKGKQFLFPRQP